MLLVFDRPLSRVEGEQLMAVYRESNTENIDHFYPGCTDLSEGLRKVEADFLRFLDEFLREGKNLCCVWSESGHWCSALRLTGMDGFWYLEALETAPEARRRGYGESLLRAVADQLRARGPVIVRDCVDKANLPSLAIHRKCGFVIDRQDGLDYLDGTTDERAYGMVYREHS